MSAQLIFLCGKMAAGKSTLAKALAAQRSAMLLVQDEWLERLFPGEIIEIADYVKYSARLRDALAPHVATLLARGISVVMDFPGNTPKQRAWFRQLFEQAGVGHEMHLIDASDALCKAQLRQRSQHLPAGTPWTTDAEFDAMTAYFQPPTDAEGFVVIRHARG